MKRFSFKLQTLLDVRNNLEEQLKLRLAAKNREIIGKSRELKELHDRLRDLQATEKSARSGNEPVLLMRYGVSYRYKLKSDILRTGRHIDELRAEANEIRRELVEATRARRALEIIRERQLSEWKKTYRRGEQNFIDDVAQQQYIASR